MVPDAVPLMRASETRTTSRTPASSSFFGSGREPASGKPGAPMGPVFCSTKTLSAVAGRSGSSMRSIMSCWDVNTTAGPVWVSKSEPAADTLMTAPSGASEPLTMTRPPSSEIGLSRV